MFAGHTGLLVGFFERWLIYERIIRGSIFEVGSGADKWRDFLLLCHIGVARTILNVSFHFFNKNINS